MIQNGKLPEEEKSDAADQKETSLVGQFKQLANLAEKVEAAKKARDGLGKPKDASKEENKRTEAAQQYNQLKSKYDQAKRRLPVFCWSGTFEPSQPPRNDSLIEHSDQLQIDIDGLSPERAREVRDLLAEDPHIEVSFLSPSRHGVKAAMLIPRCSNDREHKQAFLASKNYLEKTYGLTIDKSCKDVRRVCFLSYDPDLVLNEHATPLDLDNWIEHADRDAAGVCVEVASELPVKTSIEDSKADAEQYLGEGLQQIATASEGSRHKTYCKVAYSCGGLISRSLFDTRKYS